MLMDLRKKLMDVRDVKKRSSKAAFFQNVYCTETRGLEGEVYVKFFKYLGIYR